MGLFRVGEAAEADLGFLEGEAEGEDGAVGVELGVAFAVEDLAVGVPPDEVAVAGEDGGGEVAFYCQRLP